MKKMITVVLFSLAMTTQAQIADTAENVSPLLIGEKIPTLSLLDAKGKSVSTDQLLSKKTVIIVYRGGWCPYCNTQLSEMQDIEKDILNLGYQIVAISPDAPKFLMETEDKAKLNYLLFSDSDGSFAKATGIAFATPEKYSKMLSEHSDNKNKGFLPVPTVYVVNENQEIEFLYINPNYKKRLKANLLLAVLKNL